MWHVTDCYLHGLAFVIVTDFFFTDIDFSYSAIVTYCSLVRIDLCYFLTDRALRDTDHYLCDLMFSHVLLICVIVKLCVLSDDELC